MMMMMMMMIIKKIYNALSTSRQYFAKAFYVFS